jgi:hypothetical protein
VTAEEIKEAIRLLDRWTVPPGLVGGDDSDTYPVPVVRWSALQEAIGEPL